MTKNVPTKNSSPIKNTVNNAVSELLYLNESVICTDNNNVTLLNETISSK